MGNRISSSVFVDLQRTQQTKKVGSKKEVNYGFAQLTII